MLIVQRNFVVDKRGDCVNENKYICIWYSWGDIESPIKVPEKEDAFDYMMSIALEEVKTSIVEDEEPVTIWVKENDDGEEIIVINYHYNNEFCYYKVFDNEIKANKFYDYWMNENE